MTDGTPRGAHGHSSHGGLALVVGCEFELDAAQAVAAVLQVAPCPQPGVRIQRERWDTDSDHHGYIDLYENRCERFTIDPGSSRIAYEAQLLLSDPADVIEPDALETPVASLPDEVLNFVMPSRFCLPDELGACLSNRNRSEIRRFRGYKNVSEGPGRAGEGLTERHVSPSTITDPRS
jgi:hypothetical protein